MRAWLDWSAWGARLRAFRVVLALGYQADTGQWVTIFVATVFGAVAALAIVYGTKLLTDTVVGRGVEAALAAALLIALAGAMRQVCGRAYVSQVVQIEEKSAELLDTRPVALTAGLPRNEHHEQPDYLKELDILRDQRWPLAQMTNATVLNIQAHLRLGGAVGLLARLHSALVLLPLFGLGSLWSGRRANQIQELAQQANFERGRLRTHLKRLPGNAAAAKEIRVFGLAHELLQGYHAVALEIAGELGPRRLDEHGLGRRRVPAVCGGLRRRHRARPGPSRGRRGHCRRRRAGDRVGRPARRRHRRDHGHGQLPG